MGNSYVQLPADSTGKKLQTWDNVVGANTVHTEAVVPTHSDGTVLTSATGVQVEVASALPAGANAIGKLAANSGVDVGDVTINNIWQSDSSANWKYAAINHAGNGDNTLVAAQGAGNKIAVWSVMVVSDGTVDVRFEDGAGGTALTGQIPLQAREGFCYSAGGVVPLWVGSANTLLNLELSGAINVHGHLSYTVVT